MTPVNKIHLLLMSFVICFCLSFDLPDNSGIQDRVIQNILHSTTASKTLHDGHATVHDARRSSDSAVLKRVIYADDDFSISDRSNSNKNTNKNQQTNEVSDANRDIFQEDRDTKRDTYNALLGIESSQFKSKLYSLLEGIKSHPDDAIEAILMGELPEEEAKAITNTWRSLSKRWSIKAMNKMPFGHRSRSTVLSTSGSGRKIVPKSSMLMSSQMSNKRADIVPGSVEYTTQLPVPADGHRIRRGSSEGVLYLPMNRPQEDPCAAPKGSKLLEALPLVFLSTILSVADAVGNVINNINSNNNNNNNNNDNNINNDNTNLAANINNANQINVVPIGGRALRIARVVLNTIGKMARGAYEAVVPSAEGEDEAGGGGGGGVLDQKKPASPNETLSSDVSSNKNNQNRIRRLSNSTLSVNSTEKMHSVKRRSVSKSLSSVSNFIVNLTKRNAPKLLEDKDIEYIFQSVSNNHRFKRDIIQNIRSNILDQAGEAYVRVLSQIMQM